MSDVYTENLKITQGLEDILIPLVRMAQENSGVLYAQLVYKEMAEYLEKGVDIFNKAMADLPIFEMLEDMYVCYGLSAVEISKQTGIPLKKITDWERSYLANYGDKKHG